MTSRHAVYPQKAAKAYRAPMADFSLDEIRIPSYPSRHATDPSSPCTYLDGGSSNEHNSTVPCLLLYVPRLLAEFDQQIWVLMDAMNVPNKHVTWRLLSSIVTSGG